MERHRFFGHLDERAFLKQLELHVAAINTAIGGIPRDRVRLHVCWGNNDGPHIYDIAMASILPELYRANVGALRSSSPIHAINTNTRPCALIRCLHPCS